MELQKSYNLKKSQSILSFMLGGFMTITGLITGLFFGDFNMVSFGLFLLIMGVLQHNVTMIKLYVNYLEVKPTPLSRIKRLKIKDIQEIEEINSKKIYLYCIVNGKRKKVRLPVIMLTDEDGISFLNELKDCMKKYNHHEIK